MSSHSYKPVLSIIVPTCDEAHTLPALFDALASQQDISFDIVVSDGGSRDDTPGVAHSLGERHGIRTRVLSGERGRGRQLNAGAAVADGRYLLFLHADSHLADPLALGKGVAMLASACGDRMGDAVAGRFALRFRRSTAESPLAYYFYECKARLDRPECIHGDQGLLMPRTFFQRIGPFDTTLPMLAETRLAERIRTEGRWLLLPAEIITSARRFEIEGLYQRQVVNAILMNFASLGWDDFFHAMDGLYRTQENSGLIDLAGFLRGVRSLMQRQPLSHQLSLWHGTGGYVRNHAWQIPFFLDVRRNFRQGLPPGEGPNPLLMQFDRFGKPLLGNPVGRLAAMALTWCWFHLALARAQREAPS